jgi:hypothetical protein
MIEMNELSSCATSIMKFPRETFSNNYTVIRIPVKGKAVSYVRYI